MAPRDTDLMAPIDLSGLCDGVRTDFPLGIQAQTVKVMLNDVYLQENTDYILGRREGESRIEFKRAPRAGDKVLVMRVPA